MLTLMDAGGASCEAVTWQGKFCHLLLILLAPLISGCPQLPDYALPHIGGMDRDQLSCKQGFTYRALTVEDFRAPSLPDQLAEDITKFYAYSRMQIRPTRDSKFVITSRFSDYYNKLIWAGSVSSLAFEAVMFPDLSWWNPTITGQKTAYVLQHEQVHFALMELAARQLTRQVHQDIAALFIIDSSRQGVQDQLRKEVEALITAKNEEVIQEHTAFDQQTSLYVDPEKQQWWFVRVCSQLKESSLQAR